MKQKCGGALNPGESGGFKRNCEAPGPDPRQILYEFWVNELPGSGKLLPIQAAGSRVSGSPQGAGSPALNLSRTGRSRTQAGNFGAGEAFRHRIRCLNIEVLRYQHGKGRIAFHSPLIQNAPPSLLSGATRQETLAGMRSLFLWPT